MAVSVNILGKSGSVGERSVDESAFPRRGKKVLLKEAVIAAEARLRTGTHSALTRGEVSGSTKKIYRQKHTGHARHGSRKPQIFRGGGVTFAKKPRQYGWQLSKKARRAALAAAVRAKLDDGEVVLVESFQVKTPRTKDFANLLARLEVDGSFLVVPAEHSDALWRSCRNLPGSAYRVVADLNAYEVLRQKWLVLEEAALRRLEERFSGSEAS